MELARRKTAVALTDSWPKKVGVDVMKKFFLIMTSALLLGGAMVLATAAGQETVDQENQALAEPKAGTLIVNVSGLITDEGTLRFVLFDSKKNFLKRPIRTGVIEIKNRHGTWTTEDLPYGMYAVLVHHDVDGSGKMERHWYGKPKEPTGASNDAPAKFGPPKFKKAKFQIEESEKAITITIK